MEERYSYPNYKPIMADVTLHLTSGNHRFTYTDRRDLNGDIPRFPTFNTHTEVILERVTITLTDRSLPEDTVKIFAGYLH